MSVIRGSTAACPYTGQPMRKVLILGSTGSIGRQALEILAGAEDLRAVGLAAHSSGEIVGQALAHDVSAIALGDPAAAERARSEWPGPVLEGEEGVRELIERTEPDVVLNALVGASGLGPTVYALTHGIDVALANKESLVIGGELVTALAEATGARLIPVDSEHSALEQLLARRHPGTVERLVLTASGGPFRGLRDLDGVTAEEALDHPTWAMGGRITIDSATLINKGFEMIEAHHLFGVEYAAIDVVVHPQSIVHSLVDLTDGSTLAHLGYPDMRVPISYALRGPDRPPTGVERLDLARVGSLDFEQPDLETFPCLGLARRAGEQGGTAPCALNAADEVAVAAFLAGRIGFTGIADVVDDVLTALPAAPVGHFEDLFAADAEARSRAGESVARRAGRAAASGAPGRAGGETSGPPAAEAGNGRPG